MKQLICVKILNCVCYVSNLCMFDLSRNLTLESFQLCLFRSSHLRCSIKKVVLRNFTKFTGKHLCQSLFFNKVAGLGSATLLKKRHWHRCFPVNFAKFLITPFLQTPLGGCFCLLLVFLIEQSF